MVGAAALLALTAAAIGTVEPLVMKTIFDEIAAGGSKRSLLAHVAVLALLAILRELMAGLGNWLTWRVRLKVQFDLLEASVERLYRMPQHIQRSEGVGAIMTRLDRSIQGFVSALAELAFGALPAALYLVLAMVFMLNLDWRLTLVMILFVPIPGLIAARAAPAQILRERILLSGWSRIYGRFNEVLSGIVTVRSFAMEGVEKRRFVTEVEDANCVVERGVRHDSMVAGTQNLTVVAARLAALGIGATLAMRGEMSIGTVIAFLAYLGGLFGPVQGLAGIYRTIRTATVSIEQMFSILDAEEQVSDALGAQDVEAFHGRVEFDAVAFTYQPSGRRVLEGIDLHVQPGETVALVGASGAGKTTLMALLQRFHDPSAGSIRIDGTDLRTVTQASIRSQIAVVLQEPLLFNDTVRNNIAYGNADASRSEVEDAARAANADGFIRLLPLGYDTPIGERGALLSAGERQRLAIARALLKKPRPSILILDEATSALDADSEALVQDALEHLTRNRTTFIVAHRLSTITRADRIVVMHEGRIIESGTHSELMRLGGRYASLVHRQTHPLRALDGGLGPAGLFGVS